MSDDSQHKHRDCGTMQVHRRLLDTDRNYARRLARIEEQAYRASMMGFAAQRPGCVKIPVVVHVVYKTPAQNISQAQIDSQIDVLNDDFRKKNADVSSVPAAFAPLAGDSRIQFELATIDPDGNPTTGVTRTQTSEDSFGSGDEVKSSATGGQDAWDRDEYLNMWVCQLSGGLLGYAQFPGGAAATDGVVCTHTAFGNSGTASAPFDKGRTATHEIGHWLNLRHIWGDDGGGCSGTDHVADTPNHGGPNTGKPGFPSVSCSNGPNGDMFMNYMDYVDDDTMVMFTEGQITRMHACLDGPRSSIGTSIPCVSGPVPGKPIVKDGPKDPPKDIPKDIPKDPPKDIPKDIPKDPPKDIPKDIPKDPPKDIPKDIPKDPPKDIPKDIPKDPPKDIPKDIPKDPPKDIPKDGQKDFPKDGPKDFIKDFIKDGPWDPGPKSPFADPGPKPIFDPGPKGPFDPGLKSFFEPPIDFPSFTPFQPMAPMQPFGQPAMPFVIGTGAAPGAHQPAATQDDGRAMALQHLGMILGNYAGLHQRGLLDDQGYAGWQQAWAAYVQSGGQ